MADFKYAPLSGEAKVNQPSSAYYPKTGNAQPVETHPDNNLPPKVRIDLGFQDLTNTPDRPRTGMDDSGR